MISLISPTTSSAPAGRARRWVLPVLLTGIVGLIVLSTSTAMIMLWPQPDQVVQQSGVSEGGGEIVTARITKVAETSCLQEAYAPSGQPMEANANGGPDDVRCMDVRAELPIGKSVSFKLDGLSAATHSVRIGDSVKLVAHELNAGDTKSTRYSFYGYPRGGKMLVVAVLFALIVIAVGRWRGALSIAGVGASIALIVTFILPAILAGNPPILVAVVGAIGIMVIVLYLAHGISHRTTAALFGSIFGILFTALAGWAVTRWLGFSGLGSTDDASLAFAVPGLQMNDVLTATIVIAGLGILNDITVAQASAAWEMRALNPHLPKRHIYLAAMRVGRDHIASSIYTLVFAYAGSMFVVLLLLYTYPRDLVDLLTTEQVGQEIIRTLVGAAGLVLSMPITTIFAVLFMKEPNKLPRRQAGVHGSGFRTHQSHDG